MNVNFRGVCVTALICGMVPLANASTVNFSFSGGGITSSGTLIVIAAPDNTSGVSTAGTYEITGITGTFTDANDSVSGNITGLFTPISYVSGLAATAAAPVAFTGAGLSYDDLFFAGANSSADCPGYPFGGGYFDVYGVAFTISGGYVGEFFSNGVLPGSAGALYAAADANSTTLLDNPNAGGHSGPVGVLGSFTAAPEPNAMLLMLAGGVIAVTMMRLAGVRVRKS